MDKKEVDVSGICQLSELTGIILQKLTELNIENNRFISVTYNLAMEKYPYLRLGFCQFSEFKEHIRKGVKTIHQRLTELKAENHRITSVSYELVVEVK